MTVLTFPARPGPSGRPPPDAMPAYAELAVTSNFSFLRGASHPEELVDAAAALGLAGIGIADRNSVAGVVRVHVKAKEAGLRIVVGARLVFADGTPDILAYPADRAAWGRLTRLLTLGKRRADKGDCILGLPDLLPFVEGLRLIVMPPAPLDAAVLDKLLARLKAAAASAHSVWLGAAMLYRGDDARRLARLSHIAAAAGVPLIAVNDVLYHAPERRALADVITCVREHVTLSVAGRRLDANAERHLKAPAEMARLFRAAPQAVGETVRFLDGITFSLDQLKYDYPDETCAGYATPQEALVAFAEKGARERYGDRIPEKAKKALAHELAVTADLNYAPYFLTVHDIVQHARAQGILCQGRGSAANSVICFCLGITEVDPEKIDLLFERFVSAERREPPDIDVDFEHERREEIIQYIYGKYGRDRCGIAATVICYRGRSAVRDVGKVFGLSEDVIAALAGTMWGWSMEGVTEKEARRAGLDPSDPRLKQVMALTRELMGFPRHLSQHVGGFVIARTRLDEIVPIENAAMDDRTFVEWDKNDLDALRILKVDVLALGMLSCLRRAFGLMRDRYGVSRDLYTIQGEDAATYAMIRRADTLGVFQIESRAQMSMLPRLRPKTFYDLVIEVAIVRPGPIQGNMVHPYLRRRMGLEPVTFPAPSPEHGPADELEQVLKKTLGVPLFQEHAMRIAIVAAKFEPGEADRLRRAMATFRRVGTIETFRDKFVGTMIARGYDPAFARGCFNQIEGFGSYGFPESHAASFANLVYASAWIKCHYPDVFAAALLNSQPMGFYATAQIVRDAQEHGVTVREVDVNDSDWDCTLEPCGDGTEKDAAKRLHARHATMADAIKTTHALRLGLREIAGLSEDHGKMIAAARGGRRFVSVRDLWLRTGLPPAVLERLARADAFRSLGLDRRAALWAVRALQRAGDKDDLPLFARVAMPELEPGVALPPMLPGEHVIEDYRHLHLSLKAHPVSFLRDELAARHIVRHGDLPAMPNGGVVRVAGLVLVRQRPGEGKAIFMTLEDETGIANVILWPRTYEAYRPVILGARFIAVTGTMQNEQGVVHIVGDHFEDLTPLLGRLSQREPLPATSQQGAAERGLRPDIAGRHPRSGDSLVRLLREEPGLMDELMRANARVMPKGRNFH